MGTEESYTTSPVFDHLPRGSITEERISKLKDKLIENIRTEASREKKDGTKCKAHGEKGQIILRM